MDFLKKGIYVYNRILISNKEEQTTDIYYNIDKSQNIMQNEKSFIRIMNDYLCEILKQIELIYTGELQGSAYPGRPSMDLSGKMVMMGLYRLQRCVHVSTLNK